MVENFCFGKYISINRSLYRWTNDNILGERKNIFIKVAFL